MESDAIFTLLFMLFGLGCLIAAFMFEPLLLTCIGILGLVIAFAE